VREKSTSLGLTQKCSSTPRPVTERDIPKKKKRDTYRNGERGKYREKERKRHIEG